VRKDHDALSENSWFSVSETPHIDQRTRGHVHVEDDTAIELAGNIAETASLTRRRNHLG